MFRIDITNQDGISTSRDFAGPEVSVGRSLNCDIVLLSPSVSQRHFRVIEEVDGLVIVDDGSTNGTFVDGQRVDGRHGLAEGERVYVGDFALDLTILEEREIDPEAETRLGPQLESEPLIHESEAPTGDVDPAYKVMRDRSQDVKLPTVPVPVQANPLSSSGPGQRNASSGSAPVPRPEPSSVVDAVDDDLASRFSSASKAELGEEIDLDDWEVLKDSTGIAEIMVSRVRSVDPSRVGPMRSGLSSPRLKLPTQVEDMVAALKRYVEIDEYHQATVYGRPCTCGLCLLCRSRKLLKALES